MICRGSLENSNVQKETNNEDLANEVSEGNKLYKFYIVILTFDVGNKSERKGYLFNSDM